MGWTFDMTGKPVWTGDGEPERTVTGSNRLPKAVAAQTIDFKRTWPQLQNPQYFDERLPEGGILRRENRPPMVLPPDDPFAGAPAAVVRPEAPAAFVRADSRTPFAESREFPDITRPVDLPPVVVEASRINRPLPIVQGRTGVVLGTDGPNGELMDAMPKTEIYRGELPADGGSPGSAAPVVAGRREYRRFTPMTVEEARAKGLLWDPNQAQREADAVTATQHNIAMVRDQLQRDADASTEMTSPAARAMRGRFDAVSGASGMAAAMRATGRVGASKDIVAQILGEQRAGADSERRMREARVTPQVRDGAVYDPFTGVSEVPQRGGTVRPTRWSEYTPKELGDMVNDAVKSMMPEGDSKAFQTALMQAGNDDTKKQAVYKQFSARPTPAQELILNTALNELRNREGTVNKPQEAGGKQTQKPAYKEGQSGVFNGKNYVMKNGKWTPA